MKSIWEWLQGNPLIVGVLLVCITVAIIAAMYFGLDLSWIPALLNRFV